MGLPKGPPEKKLTSRARRTFPCFSDFWIRIVKIMCPRVGQGLDINLKKKETNSKQTTPLSSEIQ